VFRNVATGELAQSAFYAGTAAHDTGDRFIYNKTTGQLFYDDDGTGSHAQYLVATLSNHATVTASDIFVF